MTRLREVGENQNYYAEAETGFDGEGYVLMPSTAEDAGPRELEKSDGSGKFMGVNHHSTYNHERSEVRVGQSFAALQSGVVNMLCASADYTLGTELQVSSTAGVAEAHPGDDTGGTVVGTVAEATDISDEDGPAVVPVQITGRV